MSEDPSQPIAVCVQDGDAHGIDAPVPGFAQDRSPFDAKEFDGKRVLVTGGTKGIGEAIVKRLNRAGATVVTTARSVPADLAAPDLFVQADLSTLNRASAITGSE